MKLFEIVSNQNNTLTFMKSYSFWLKAICIIIIPYALFYLYQFGYTIVDKAFGISRLKNNLDQQSISGHGINYSEIISPVIIVLLLIIMVVMYNYRKQSK